MIKTHISFDRQTYVDQLIIPVYEPKHLKNAETRTNRAVAVAAAVAFYFRC